MKTKTKAQKKNTPAQYKRTRNFYFFLALVFTAAGLLFGYLVYRGLNNFNANALRTQGIVKELINYEKKSSGIVAEPAKKGTKIYVEYTDTDGVKQTFKSSVYQDDIYEGSAVEVGYLEDYPQTARVMYGGPTIYFYLFPFMFFVGGLAFFIVFAKLNFVYKQLIAKAENKQ